VHLVRFIPVAALISLALVAPPLASAHAELLSTSPADGVNLDEAPTEVVMVFDGELDPDGSEFTVTDASGAEVGAGEVDLDVAERNEMRGDVEITAPGTYTVTWTAVAADGDEESGEFAFGYRANRGGASDEAPNTSVSPSGGDSRLIVTGVALLAVAGLRALRTRWQ